MALILRRARIFCWLLLVYFDSLCLTQIDVHFLSRSLKIVATSDRMRLRGGSRVLLSLVHELQRGQPRLQRLHARFLTAEEDVVYHALLLFRVMLPAGSLQLPL